MAITDAISDAFYKPSSITTTTAIVGKDASQMDMDDFFKLLVAQMTNQDMMNPQDNTEFVAQMAQFTSLRGIQTLTEYSLSAYAVSYVGKNVIIAEVNNVTGELEQISGAVESVTFYDGQPMVIVNGKAYDLHKVMEISSSPINIDDANKTDAQKKTEQEEAARVAELAANSNALSLATPYIGKTVTVEIIVDGNRKQITGKVVGVSAKGGHAQLEFEDDTAYPLNSIVTVWDN